MLVQWPLTALGASTEVYIIHIPKTAGTSLQMDLQLSLHQKIPRKEYCARGANRSRFRVTFFRNPRDHVLSQYFECRDDHWGRTVTNGTLFPRTEDNPYVGYTLWVEHFARSVASKVDDFGCYNPWNMQARYMTCGCKFICAHHFVPPQPRSQPSALDAITMFKELDVVGITEHYSTSICLIMYKLGKLPDACFCDSKKQVNQTHLVHGVSPHSNAGVPSETLGLVDRMTTVDQQVYLAAMQYFMLEVRKVEAVTSRRLLCGR